MPFISFTLNHFRAVRAWATANQATVQMDVGSFELEIKARNRFYKLYPQFRVTLGGRLGHVPTLIPEANGLIGWLPYRPPLRWKLGMDKLAFKAFAVQHGHQTPLWWIDVSQAHVDFILKNSAGSFGYELYGPFHPGSTRYASLRPTAEHEGVRFAEQFVKGRNLKLWFWGRQPFFAHLHDYPQIQGDGSASVAELIQKKLALLGIAFEEAPERLQIHASLDYQGVDMDHVLPRDQSVWLDYRYGRQYIASRVTHVSDNALDALPPRLMKAALALGKTISTEMFEEFPAPVLYAVDGVVTPQGDVQWLELNTNPILPPDGYAIILDTLFGASSLP